MNGMENAEVCLSPAFKQDYNRPSMYIPHGNLLVVEDVLNVMEILDKPNFPR